jgi:hypothetical protein
VDLPDCLECGVPVVEMRDDVRSAEAEFESPKQGALETENDDEDGGKKQ